MFHHVCIQREVQLFVFNIRFCDLKNKMTTLLIRHSPLSRVSQLVLALRLTTLRDSKGLDNFLSSGNNHLRLGVLACSTDLGSLFS